MKQILSAVLFICVIFFSCKKEIGGKGNRPPVANAGPDQTIILPTNTVALDGSASTDPDNNISSYLWTKISGPSSFNIADTNAVQTQVTNLVEGVYQFELKVTDAGGLFSKDTMQVVVNLGTNSPVDIYVAGFERNSNVKSNAKYWKNGVAVNLTDGSQFATAKCIAVVNNDVYVSGMEGTDDIIYGPNVAKYWKNGIAHPLDAGAAYHISVMGMTVVNNDVYVAGWVYPNNSSFSYAKYWKNGVVVNLADSSHIAHANSIAVVGSDVYVAGDENSVVKYWKNGVAVNLSSGSRANSIAVVGSDVYVAGIEASYNSNIIAKYWKNGVAVNLTDGSTYAWALSIAVVNNDVYVAGYEAGIAKYWKNGVAVNLTNGSTHAAAHSIAIVNNDVYVAGHEINGSSVKVAKYWKNGVAVNLTNGNYDAYANAIVVQ